MSVASSATASRTGGVLAATCLSTLVVNANTSAVSILLPAISDDTGTSVETLQWAVTGYSLVGAAVIVTSGSLGDVFGRKRVFQLGLLLFVGSCVLISLSNTGAQVIGGRLIQGASGATILACGLSLLSGLPETPERNAVELRLQIALGTAWVAIKGYAAPDVERAYGRARELCRQLGDSQELGNFGMMKNGISPEQSTPADWQRAADDLMAQKPLVRKYYGQEYIDALGAGEVWITQAWSGDIFQKNLEEGTNLKFVVPEEGATLWTDNMTIPITAQHSIPTAPPISSGSPARSPTSR